jgi:hypothetical protein
MRQPLNSMMKTARAFSQCVIRSHNGWIICTFVTFSSRIVEFDTSVIRGYSM